MPAIALASCAVAVLAFGVQTRDDAYSTFWVAEQLARTGHLVNINGAHLEQSSSLGYVLLLALLSLVTSAPLPAISYVVGISGLAATIWLSARLAGRVRPGAEVATAVVVGTAFPLVFWATGGLETMVAAACVLWFLLALHDLVAGPAHVWTTARFAAAAAAAVVVRPDTMLLAVLVGLVPLALVGLSALAGPRARRLAVDARGAVVAAVTVTGEAAVLTGFRVLEFGQVLPQPDLAKAGGLSWFPTGSSYVASSLPVWMWLALLVLFAAGTAWCVRSGSSLGVLCALTFAGGTLGICFTRGDWMGGARLLAPYLAPGLVVAVLGAWSLRAAWRRVAVGALVVVQCVALTLLAGGANWLSSQFTSPYGPSAAVAFEADVGSFLGATVGTSDSRVPSLPWYTAWDYASTRDAVFLAAATPVLRRLLDADAGRGPVTLGSTQGGMVIYTWQNEFGGRLDFIDMDDVVTDDFSRCRGLHESYGGDIITLAQWTRDAGGCAPPLPDLLLMLRSPLESPLLLRSYHVVSAVSMTYLQSHLVGPSVLLGTTEYLAARDGWPRGR